MWSREAAGAPAGEGVPASAAGALSIEALVVSPLPPAIGCGAVVWFAPEIVVVFAEGSGAVGGAADAFVCADVWARKPVVAFAGAPPDVPASNAASATAPGSAGASCGFATVASVTAWPALLVAPAMLVSVDAVLGAPFPGRGGGVSAADVDEVAAMAAAAMASGAVELVDVGGVTLTVAGAAATGIMAAAITVAAGVGCVAFAVGSIGVPVSVVVLSAGLVPAGFDAANFAPLCAAGLALPAELPGANLVSVGGTVLAAGSLEVFAAGDWLEVMLSGAAPLSLGGAASVLHWGAGGADGSGAAGGLAELAGRLPSISAAKLSGVGDGSGRAGLGGAAW